MVQIQDIIVQLNTDVVTIHGNGDTYTCLDKDGKTVTVDMSAVNAEFTKQNYKNERANEYPSVVDQLDLIYNSGIDAWKAKIKETKDKYPKS
jgi:hypothetical protein